MAPRDHHFLVSTPLCDPRECGLDLLIFPSNEWTVPKEGYKRRGLPSCSNSFFLVLLVYFTLIKQAAMSCPMERSTHLGTEGGVSSSASKELNPANNHGRELGSISFPSQDLR